MHTDWSSLSLVILVVMILAHILQKPTNSLSQQIRILPKTIFLVNCWPSGKYVHLLYMYSILGRGSFCFNYCLNSAWHGGDEFVALLRWYGSPGFFDSGLQLICIIGLLFLIFFWQYIIDFLWGSGLVSLLASQEHQHHGHLTNFWCFWQCGQVPNPAGKWNQLL